MDSVKISSFEFDNVKRIKAVSLKPSKSGLTVIGGDNNQGKTSVLDSIAWALGGDKYKPSKSYRDGSVVPPYLHIVLSNGLIVERKGKNSDLKVTDPNGAKAGQILLNSFIEQLALDLPKFMEASDKEKADTLLKIIGVGDRLYEMDQEIAAMMNERLLIGRVADQKLKFAKEQPYYPDVPAELISAGDLIKQQQEILARNGENQRKREKLSLYESQLTLKDSSIKQLETQIAALNVRLDEERAAKAEIEKNIEIAKTDALSLVDESTEELEKNINNIEEVNRKIRANMDKEKAEDDARTESVKYEEYTKKIEGKREERLALLNDANLPLPGLSIEENVLTYNGQKWDNMSGSEQLKVATAIVRKLNPQCGFVLIDKLEQMDLNTMQEFGKWLENEGLQAIATRVSLGDECSIIIEDGYAKNSNVIIDTNAKTEWKEGEF